MAKIVIREALAEDAYGGTRIGPENGAYTFVRSPLSVPFWVERMGYERRAVVFRKRLG